MEHRYGYATARGLAFTLAAGVVGSAAVAGVVGYALINAVRRRFDFAGKVALITGGSRGLGLQLAREFGAKGMRVAICARDTEELQAAQFIDMHTHLFKPTLGTLGLWGIDELLSQFLCDQRSGKSGADDRDIALNAGVCHESLPQGLVRVGKRGVLSLASRGLRDQ